MKSWNRLDPHISGRGLEKSGREHARVMGGDRAAHQKWTLSARGLISLRLNISA
jgi:hypothetical protein